MPILEESRPRMQKESGVIPEPPEVIVQDPWGGGGSNLPLHSTDPLAPTMLWAPAK